MTGRRGRAPDPSAAAPQIVLPLSLATVPPAAAGTELFAQFGGLDYGQPNVPALLSRAFRVRLELN